MSTATAAERATCGDHGGVTVDGRPCDRPAGWGADRVEGPCRDHDWSVEGRVVGEIESDSPLPAPPEHLSDAAASRWRELTGTWVFGPGELLLLEEGLAAWDRVREARSLLREEGFVVTNPDSGNPKPHPASRELDKSLTQMRQALKQLDLPEGDDAETT